MHTLIFCDEETFKEITLFAKRETKLGEKYLYAAMNKRTTSLIKDSGNSLIPIYEIGNKISWNHETILKNTLDLICNLQHVKLKIEKLLSQKLAADNSFYWDIIEGPLVCYKLYPMIFVLEICRELFNEKIDHIVLPNVSKLSYKVFYQYAISRGVPVKVLKQKKIRLFIKNLKFFLFTLLSETWQIIKNYSCKRNRKVPLEKEVASKKYTILFLCFFSRQIESLLPILRKLKKERDVECKVLISSGAMGRNILEREEISFDVLEDKLNELAGINLRIKNIKSYFQWQRFLSKNFPGIQSRFQGINIIPILADEMLLHITPFLFNLLGFVKRYLQKLQPDLIVQVDDANMLNRSFLFSGKSFNIPTLHVQYGLFNRTAVDWLSNKADKIAVFGAYFKELLVKTGIDEKRIIVTGQPRYDSLVEKRNKFLQEIKKKNENNKKKVLFSSVPFFKEEFSYGYSAISHEEYIMQLKALYSQISKMKNIELLVKLHPNPADNSEHHIKVLSDINPSPSNIRILHGKTKFHNLLTKCDALITHHSTTVIEAMLYLKPVFIINLTGRPDFADYVKEGAAAGIYSEEEVCHVLENILFVEKEIKRMIKAQESFLNKHYSKLDGKATDHIINLINQMLYNAI